VTVSFWRITSWRWLVSQSVSSSWHWTPCRTHDHIS